MFWLPLALSAIPAVLSTGVQAQQLYHQYRQNEENKRWWNDYFKNTGLAPEDIRYPYRSGYMATVTGDLSLASAGLSFVSSNLSRLYR